MKVAKIATSYVAGPGKRLVIWTAGCSGPWGERAQEEVKADGSRDGHCVGCQAKKLWANRGREMGAVDVAYAVAKSGLHAVTFMGGEPFEQLDLLPICQRLRAADPGISIIIYTGAYWEDVRAVFPADMLQTVDIIVDGPYRKRLDDPTIQWRGSRNQRPIDVQATLASGQAGQVVEMDWDSPAFTITSGGDIITAVGYAQYVSDAGRSARSPRCGEVGLLPA